jgi:hypothetical protein
MKRIFGRSVLISIAAVAALYAGDWAVLRVRMARQTAFSSVQVNQFLVARLKGNRQEYFHMGTGQEPCVKAIFPHEGDLPCWWLRGHAMRWDVTGLMVPEVRGGQLHKMRKDEVFLSALTYTK